jgi:serine/threonine protein kinase
MSIDDLQPGDRFLDYIIQGCLGQGGMGTVYEAVEEFSGSAVAIKCLRGCFTGREDFVLRLKQESKFYSKLRHPNIVRMNRAGITDDGRVFIVMERLVGRTLRSLLDRTNRLDFLNSVHVLLQIGEAIGAAHEAGIWHRDLKPENVMVGTRGGERGHVWVLDFGIASDGAANTDELPRLGTFRYLSPEQCRGLKPDGRADIYAFGIIAYEMLTGRHTFLDKRTDATAASCPTACCLLRREQRARRKGKKGNKGNTTRRRCRRRRSARRGLPRPCRSRRRRLSLYRTLRSCCPSRARRRGDGPCRRS